MHAPDAIRAAGRERSSIFARNECDDAIQIVNAENQPVPGRRIPLPIVRKLLSTVTAERGAGRRVMAQMAT
jgi:hypothetical protein